LIARIWGDIMIWDAENLPGKNQSAHKFSQAGSCRDSRILKNRNTTGFAMEPIRANEGRDDVADRPGAVDTRVSGPKKHEPEDAQDQDGKAGGNGQ
jgi:hypothetical protein